MSKLGSHNSWSDPLQLGQNYERALCELDDRSLQLQSIDLIMDLVTVFTRLAALPRPQT